MEKIEKDLKQRGIDRNTAKKVLDMWAKLGAQDPQQLRKLLAKKSFSSLTTVSLQLLLDLGASAGAIYTAVVIGQTQEFGPFSLAVEFLAYTLGLFFVINTFTDVVTLVTLGATSLTYGTNADAVLSAVRHIAGVSGLEVVDKVKGAANIFKVVQTLNQISDMLKEKTAEKSTLSDLAAYLTLDHAQREYGWDPDAEGIPRDVAADVATLFVQYDTNDDGELDREEFVKLCEECMADLSEPELELGFAIIDKSGDNRIQFTEFVDWYFNKVNVPASTTGK